jgi:hypothetical protein
MGPGAPPRGGGDGAAARPMAKEGHELIPRPASSSLDAPARARDSRRPCYSPLHCQVARMEACVDQQPRSSVSMDPFRASTRCMGSHMMEARLVAAGDTLNAVDPASGKMLRSIDVAADAGTAFDGQHLFQLAADRSRRSTEDRPSARHGPGAGDPGLTGAEGTLWVGAVSGPESIPRPGRFRTIESNRFVTGSPGLTESSGTPPGRVTRAS